MERDAGRQGGCIFRGNWWMMLTPLYEHTACAAASVFGMDKEHG